MINVVKKLEKDGITEGELEIFTREKNLMEILEMKISIKKIWGKERIRAGLVKCNTDH